jgi:hypothetical protein
MGFLTVIQEEATMKRWLFGCLAALAISSGNLLADEVKGKVKNVDPEKHALTVTFIDQDQTFILANDVKVIHLVGKKAKKAQTEDLPGGLTALSKDSEVTLTSEKKDGVNRVTTIRVEGLAKKKKK